jgi:hypothetical protein
LLRSTDASINTAFPVSVLTPLKQSRGRFPGPSNPVMFITIGEGSVFVNPKDKAAAGIKLLFWLVIETAR